MVSVHFTIELGDRQVTAEVSPAQSIMATALRGSTTTKRHARHMIIHDLILPQLLRRGIPLDNLNWIDGPSGQFPVITRIIVDGTTVIHRHGITDEGVPGCNCPDRCPIRGHDQNIY